MSSRHIGNNGNTADIGCIVVNDMLSNAAGIFARGFTTDTSLEIQSISFILYENLDGNTVERPPKH